MQNNALLGKCTLSNANACFQVNKVTSHHFKKWRQQKPTHSRAKSVTLTTLVKSLFYAIVGNYSNWQQLWKKRHQNFYVISKFFPSSSCHDSWNGVMKNFWLHERNFNNKTTTTTHDSLLYFFIVLLVISNDFKFFQWYFRDYFNWQLYESYVLKM